MPNITMRYVSCFYWLTALSYLSAGDFFSYPLQGLHKAAPIVFLALITLVVTHKPTRLWLFMALIASSSGDILLASELTKGFIYGLAAFALAHLCYSMCFLPRFCWSSKALKFMPLLIMVLATVLFKVIPHTNYLLVPVLVYMGIITLMATLAIFATQRGYWLTAGALLFVVSDCLIALNKFVSAVPAEHLLVMSSYYVAQYCLFIGCVKQVNHHASPS